LPVSWPQPS